MGMQWEELYEPSKLVENMSRIKLGDNKRVVGDISFTRESGLGADRYRKDP